MPLLRPTPTVAMVRVTGQMKTLGANKIVVAIHDDVLLDVGAAAPSTSIAVHRQTRLFHATCAESNEVKVFHFVVVV